VLIGKSVKKILEKFGFSFTYLRVWYDFSPRQRRVESGKKMTKKVKEKTSFDEKSGKIEKKVKK